MRSTPAVPPLELVNIGGRNVLSTRSVRSRGVKRTRGVQEESAAGNSGDTSSNSTLGSDRTEESKKKKSTLGVAESMEEGKEEVGGKEIRQVEWKWNVGDTHPPVGPTSKLAQHSITSNYFSAPNIPEPSSPIESSSRAQIQTNLATRASAATPSSLATAFDSYPRSTSANLPRTTNLPARISTEMSVTTGTATKSSSSISHSSAPATTLPAHSADDNLSQHGSDAHKAAPVETSQSGRLALTSRNLVGLELETALKIVIEDVTRKQYSGLPSLPSFIDGEGRIRNDKAGEFLKVTRRAVKGIVLGEAGQEWMKSGGAEVERALKAGAERFKEKNKKSG